MFLFILGVDDDVVKVGDAKLAEDRCKDVIYNGLERRWGVLQAKRHGDELI